MNDDRRGCIKVIKFIDFIDFRTFYKIQQLLRPSAKSKSFQRIVLLPRSDFIALPVTIVVIYYRA